MILSKFSDIPRMSQLAEGGQETRAVAGFYYFIYFVCLRGIYRLPLDFLRYYTMILQHIRSIVRGMLDANPGPLPQKFGALYL